MNVQLTRKAPGALPALRQRRVGARTEDSAVVAAPADLSLRGSVLARLGRQAWWDPETANVVVVDGVVSLQGLVPAGIGRGRARNLLAAIPGVRAVEDLRKLSRDW